MFHSIANKIAVAAMAITMTIVIVLGGASYLFTRWNMEVQIHDKLDQEASVIRDALEALLTEINYDVESLAGNIIVVNALIDSEGRDIYIQPFMQGYRIPHELPFFMELCDFEGKPITGSHKERRYYSDNTIIETVIAEERPYITVEQTQQGDDLLLAYPVFYGATGMAEGMLVVEMPFAPIVEAALGSTTDYPQRLLEVLIGKRKVWSGKNVDQAEVYTVFLDLDLDVPLAELGLRIRYGEAKEKIYSPLRKLTFVYLVLGFIVLVITLILSRYISRRLTFPLKALSKAADDVARTGMPNHSISITSDDEVQVLASSFNTMLEKLRESHHTLEQRVEERTRELEQLNKKLQNYSETQSVLLWEVNHRVKNNLTAIISMLHQEEDRAQDEGMGVYASRLKEVVGRISGLLVAHSLLSSSRWAPLSLAYLCNNIIQATLKGSPHDMMVKLEVTPSPEVYVSSDQAHYLAIVLNELTTNSLKYSLVDRKSLTIGYSIILQEDTVKLIYHDNGPGYPPAILAGELSKGRIGIPLMTGIVTKSMRGKIELLNENGAKVQISFPKMALVNN